MEIFHMTDIIELLNLPRPPHGRISYYIQCPCCDDKPRGRHLNINLKKDVFRCPKCGVHGGVFDLYSLYTGISRDNVRKELKNQLGTPAKIKKHEKQYAEEVPESPCADIKIRHKTYTELLSMLTLAKDHRKNLLERGFTDGEIDELEYRSTPTVGLLSIAKKLCDRGCCLSGVPGFYKTKAGEWIFIQEKRGILIPIRTPDGMIQGLQVRRDNTTKRKFRWISSVGKPYGCGAENWIHHAGKATETVLLTEGAMKAELIHRLGKHTVIAIQGVNSLKHLGPAIEYLKANNTQEIKIAFDMDFLSKRGVQKAFLELLLLLDKHDICFGCYLWDPAYKGLDDFIWEYKLQKKRTLNEEGRIAE